jgi:hypothetical protein
VTPEKGPQASPSGCPCSSACVQAPHTNTQTQLVVRRPCTADADADADALWLCAWGHSCWCLARGFTRRVMMTGDEAKGIRISCLRSVLVWASPRPQPPAAAAAAEDYDKTTGKGGGAAPAAPPPHARSFRVACGSRSRSVARAPPAMGAPPPRGLIISFPQPPRALDRRRRQGRLAVT